MGYELISYKKVSSTNDIAKKLEVLHHEITVVSANQQTCGRGRQGRIWESGKDLGLWISIVIEPEIEMSSMPMLTFVAANAVAMVLREELVLEAELKWPNDVFVGGKKICGILAETTERTSEISGLNEKNRVILGVGINVSHQEKDLHLGLNATSVNLELLKQRNHPNRGNPALQGKASSLVTLQSLLPMFMGCFEKEYKIFLSECKANGHSETIVKHWLEHNQTVGSKVKFEFDGGLKEGTAVGVTLEGYLVINTADGSFVKVGSGEVLCK